MVKWNKPGTKWNTVRFHLHEKHKLVKFTEAENKTTVTRGPGDGGREISCLVGTQF